MEEDSGEFTEEEIDRQVEAFLAYHAKERNIHVPLDELFRAWVASKDFTLQDVQRLHRVVMACLVGSWSAIEEIEGDFPPVTSRPLQPP